MRLRMLKSVRGSQDGISLLDYVAGESYDIANTQRGLELAAMWIREGIAEEVPAAPVQAAAQPAAQTPGPAEKPPHPDAPPPAPPQHQHHGGGKHNRGR